MVGDPLPVLLREIEACRLCAAHLPLGPRPVIRAAAGARILVIGQAPGTKVHRTGIPFNDPSGDRLRDWMGIDRDIFYDESRIAIMPMGLCYPGRNARGGDAPPRPECAPLWQARVAAAFGRVELVLLVGGWAQARRMAAGRAGGADADRLAPRRHDMAMGAARLQQLAMHVQHIPAAAALVQIVDILGDQQHLARPVALQPGQRQMRRVGLDVGVQQLLAAGIVEIMDPHRIVVEGLRRRHILDAHARPDAVRIAESVEAGFLGDAGPGQDNDGFSHATAPLRPILPQSVSVRIAAPYSPVSALGDSG